MTRPCGKHLPPRLALAAALALLSAVIGCHRGLTLLPQAELITTVAPGEVVGLVTDAHLGAPLADAVVRLVPGEVQASTDPAGRFRLGPVSEGRYRLRVLRVGYVERTDSLVLDAKSGAAVAVRLSRTTVRLEHVSTGAGTHQ